MMGVDYLRPDEQRQLVSDYMAALKQAEVLLCEKRDALNEKIIGVESRIAQWREIVKSTKDITP